MPTAYKILGSAKFADKADLIFTVHRPDIKLRTTEIHVRKVRRSCSESAAWRASITTPPPPSKTRHAVTETVAVADQAFHARGETTREAVRRAGIDWHPVISD